jgi:hypothetical protein
VSDECDGASVVVNRRRSVLNLAHPPPAPLHPTSFLVNAPPQGFYTIGQIHHNHAFDL